MNNVQEAVHPSDAEKIAVQNKKKSRKTVVIIIIALVAVMLVLGTVAAIVSGVMLIKSADTRLQAATELIDNSTVYVREFNGDISDIKYYSFRDGYASEEIHHFDGKASENNSVSGDITDYNKLYRIDTSLFSNKVSVYTSSDGKTWDRIIKKRLLYSKFFDYWEFEDLGNSSTEDVISTRNKILGDENFSDGNYEDAPPSQQHNTDISEEILVRAVYCHEINITHASGGISIPIEIGKVMDRCCKDYTVDYSPYYETKYEYIAEESIEDLENSDFAKYLGNSFIVNIRGKILHNPDVAGYYTESQDLLTLLVHFDENDECMGFGHIYISKQFETCATIMAVSEAF